MSGANSPTARPDSSPLPAKYKPSEHEASVRARWESSGAFHADPLRVLRDGRAPYSIFIPPPNVTARLHLGHALNNTLQDVLARAHRMKGFEVLWMPGTDHAGIATQTVVEQRLLKEEGKRRTDFAREEFVARVQAWKDEYEAVITDQLKAIGCSCDWRRQRFTMDNVCAGAVREAFFRLFRDGLIYRGKRLVNWDPATQTALADDEVEMEEVDGFFYYLRYPLVQVTDGIDRHNQKKALPATLAGLKYAPVTWGELAARGYPGAESHPDDEQAWVTVATTRPETYLGDTAVALHPRDPRAASLRHLSCQLPLVGRIIPLIEDEYVVMPVTKEQAEDAEKRGEAVDPKARFATGFLKVTPAHDPNDYEIGRRHDLKIINVMAPDASISDKHGWTDVGDAHLFVGLSREEARKKVIAEFKARHVADSNGPLFEKQVEYRHSVGHSYRSHVPIEPYLSDQWYCRVTDDRLRGAALRAMDPAQRSSADAGRATKGGGDGALSFFPERFARTFETWHENLRDWCISRQLWWGHRIPVWSGSPESARRALEGVDSDRAVLHENGEAAFVCVRSEGDAALIRALEAAQLRRDPDVLDTWFSSALWPMSTLGWPAPPPEMKGLLEAFNPSAVLATAREIITLWVSRMTMFNRYLLPEGHPATKSGDASYGSSGKGGGPVPFRHVYINAVVQDGHGQRMSKSLGNGVDPLDIVHSHGTDALRLVLVQTATGTQDVRMPVDLVCPHCGEGFEPAWITSPAGYKVAAPRQSCPRCAKPSVSAYGVSSGSVKPTDDAPQARNGSTRFDAGRNFCTKLWNATRFALMNLEGEAAPGAVRAAKLSLPDRWMLSRLTRTIREIDGAIAQYQFAQYAELVYDLFWRDFCDWYLEAIKPTVRSSPEQRAVLGAVLESIVRLLHPIAPYVTEVLHGALRRVPRAPLEGLLIPESEQVCVAAWPAADPSLESADAERSFARLQALVEQIRQVRSAKGVEPRRRVKLHAGPSLADDVRGWAGVVEALSGADLAPGPAPAGAAPFVFEGADAALSDLADAVDPSAERQRLSESLSKLEKDIAALETRLGNPGYADRAPPHLVQQTRDQLSQKIAERDALKLRLSQLGA
ncbi:MAG: valine--tRNA ligase [Planctomycetota bacterium]|nr:valine--tRNA ligase [Planctomycetota bacterium]